VRRDLRFWSFCGGSPKLGNLISEAARSNKGKTSVDLEFLLFRLIESLGISLVNKLLLIGSESKDFLRI